MPAPLSNPHHPLMRWAAENGMSSLNELAAKLDVSKSRLSQIVARKNRPNVDLALRIIKVTSIPFEELVSLTAPEIRAGIRAGWEKPAKRRRRK